MNDVRPILFLCDKAPSRGAPHVHMAAVWLSHRGFDVRCLCSGWDDEAGARDFPTPLGRVRASFLRSLDGKPNPLQKLSWHLRFLLRLLAARLRAAPGTQFYVHGHVVCPAAWIALAGLPKARVLYQTQDYLEPGRHPLWAFFERKLARRAGRVICNEVNRGRFMASDYRLAEMPVTLPTRLPKAWVAGVEEPADRLAALRALGLPVEPGQRLVLHQGPYSPQIRCGRNVLDAFVRLPAGYILVFTGNRSGAWRAEVEADLAARPSLQGRVHFLDELSFSQLLHVTVLFDMGLLLYPNDGVGNFYQAPGRLTEYVGCGLPIITSRFPGLELLVLKYGLGQACDPQSPEDIARGILAVGEQDPEARARDRARLRQTFADELCYDQNAPLLERVVLEALQPSADPREAPRP